MVAIDDEDLEVPSAPLVYASVDNFVALTLDERGNLIRDSVQVTREPDPVNHADLSLVEPVNRGASYDNVVGLGEAMIEPPRPAIERLTFGSVRALMRRGAGTPAVSPPKTGIVVMRASGHTSKKPLKPIPADERAGQQVGGYVPFFRVSGLTPGEADFFRRRPNIAKTVLREDIFGRIVRNELVEPIVKVERMRFAFDVFGLEDHELRMFRAYRNAVRLALIDHARSIDPKRIEMIDGNAPSSVAPKLRTYEQVTLGEYT